MQFPALRLLSRDELERIHQAALRILDEVGILLEHTGAQDLLEGAGARIDRSTNRVYMPPELVEAKRVLIPKRFTYHGRTAEYDYTAALDGDIGGRSSGGPPYYIDPVTGASRRANIADWRDFCKVTDALPNIAATANQHCGDVPGLTSDLHSLRAMLECQRKCSVHGAATVTNLRYQIEMMLAVRGTREALAERPMVHHMVPPDNPLFLHEDLVAQILLAVEYGLPMDMPVMSIAGVSSPATLAGTLAQNLAEELAATTLVQTVRPGHPQAFFIDPMVGNMRTAEALGGAPESALLLGAICQLGTELFGVPTEAIGFVSDGFTGAQTMFHKAQNLIFQVLSGGKLIVGAGTVESIMALSPIQLVIDDELIAIARRWLQGIKVDEEALAVDTVARVGPRGSYLADAHTVSAIRTRQLVTLHLAERESRRQVWEAAGKKTLESRAAEKAQSIIERHEVPPLPDEVRRELAAILKKADIQVAGADGSAASAPAGV